MWRLAGMLWVWGDNDGKGRSVIASVPLPRSGSLSWCEQPRTTWQLWHHFPHEPFLPSPHCLCELYLGIGKLKSRCSRSACRPRSGEQQHTGCPCAHTSVLGVSGRRSWGWCCWAGPLRGHQWSSCRGEGQQERPRSSVCCGLKLLLSCAPL